jgi:type IV secretory pathway VirJ component
LVGYSSGATLVYAVLAQAPPNTFLGAISLGFCPDLPLKRPLCKGYGLTWTKGPKDKGVSFLPATHLQQPWLALQGAVDQVCDVEATRTYVAQVAGGEAIVLPKVGHGFSVQKNWMPQFRSAFAKITAGSQTVEPSREASLSDLPLVELPAPGDGDAMALIVSGDGGWAGIDRDVGNGLVSLGVPVVGLNSLRYFWSPRTPDQGANDLDRVLTHYLEAWGKTRAILIGYSMGADVLPFMVTRLPPATRSRVGGVVLLGPSATAQFEFHLANWVGVTARAQSYPTRPEVERLGDLHVLCLAGADESDSLCRADLPKVDRRLLDGGHHFGGDYQRIVTIIAQEMGLP